MSQESLSEKSPAPRAIHQGRRIALPGLASAHSHAFQRLLRGRTQRPSEGADSFWSWRGLMYDLASRLNPEQVFHISRLAFTELAMAGYCAVGEFHYLHHDIDGSPYEDRIAMSDAVIRAAREAGLRITLLRVVYERGGAGKELDIRTSQSCLQQRPHPLGRVEAGRRPGKTRRVLDPHAASLQHLGR